MSKGLKEDVEATKEQLRSRSSLRDGKRTTWLRHVKDRASGIIDEMLLEGHTNEEIVIEIKHRLGNKITDPEKKVTGHISHLGDGSKDPWQRKGDDQNPHKLELKENVNNRKWEFVFKDAIFS